MPISEHDQTHGQDPNGADVDSQVLNLSLGYHPLYVAQFAEQGVDSASPNNNMMEEEGSHSDSDQAGDMNTGDERRSSKISSGSRSRFPQNTKVRPTIYFHYNYALLYNKAIRKVFNLLHIGGMGV